MMKRRWFIGSIAALGVAVLGTASALAVGGHLGRHGLMKRFIDSAIDDALESAKATPEQRTRIRAATDRAVATVQTHMADRHARFGDLLAAFESDRLDPLTIQAMRTRHEEEHRRVADAIQAAVVEAHDTLRPEQRRAVADWIRAHRHH